MYHPAYRGTIPPDIDGQLSRCRHSHCNSRLRRSSGCYGIRCPRRREAVVKDVLSIDEDARSAVLEEVHKEFADMPVTVYGYYKSADGELRQRGMARIVNASQCLSIIAQAYPKMKLALRLTDPVITENNGIFLLSEGECRKVDNHEGKLDYDIDIEVLTSIVFGNDVTRHILDFPAVRPFISLMLD